jgi:hypothetical protein
MAIYRIFPQQDAFIFSETPIGNSGMDEILEIGGYADISGAGEASRILIQFDSTEISDIVTNKIGSSNYSASLGVYLADAYQVPVNTVIYTYPVYSTVGWDNGTGKYGDIPTNTSGVSWQYQKAGEVNTWPTTQLPSGVTYSTVGSKPGGGAWCISSGSVNLEFTQSNTIKSTYDIDINVTNAVKLWNAGNIVNNGFILKLSSSLEFNTSSSIRLKYFGADTNTIYPPYLEFKWNDTTYNTGSLSTLNNNLATIRIGNNKGEYVDTGKQRFRITAQPKYPVRTFSTSSVYLINHALPVESYWGIRDENTEEMVINFDNTFTKISCDSTGPYFDIYMDGLQPERYYRILIKSTIDGSTTVVSDSNNNIFKVVRNG